MAPTPDRTRFSVDWSTGPALRYLQETNSTDEDTLAAFFVEAGDLELAQLGASFLKLSEDSAKMFQLIGRWLEVSRGVGLVAIGWETTGDVQSDAARLRRLLDDVRDSTDVDPDASCD